MQQTKTSITVRVGSLALTAWQIVGNTNCEHKSNLYCPIHRGKWHVFVGWVGSEKSHLSRVSPHPDQYSYTVLFSRAEVPKKFHLHQSPLENQKCSTEQRCAGRITVTWFSSWEDKEAGMLLWYHLYSLKGIKGPYWTYFNIFITAFRFLFLFFKFLWFCIQEELLPNNMGIKRPYSHGSPFPMTSQSG